MTPPGEGAPSLEAAAPAALRWSGLTHPGRFRSNNEDAFLGLKFDGREVSHLGKVGAGSLEGADFVFAVSDGMGGERSGEFASRCAIDRITQILPRLFRLSSAGPEGAFADSLRGLFLAIHGDLLNLGRSYPECRGMGTTLSLCWISRRSLHFGHVGDSRIYHLPREGALSQLSHDHTHVGWLRRNGEINERQARAHPGRTALNQALGADHQFVAAHTGVLAYRPGDRFILCSDGVVDGLWDRRIEEIVRARPSGDGGPSAAQRLVDEAVETSGRDNSTAIVVEIGSSAGRDAPPPP
jgi:serine/threonine protein phosphatase PrpC